MNIIGKLIRFGTSVFAVVLVFLSGFSIAHAITFSEFVDKLLSGLGVLIIQLIFALAFIYFLWGVLMYGFSNDETSKDKAKQVILWGVLGLAAMFGVYGMVRILQNTILF